LIIKIVALLMASQIEWSLNFMSLSESELSEEELLIWQRAKQACDKSYSPYSRFCVGSAILLQNGIIVEGTNQENAAYPSGLCAERVALFGSGVLHPKEPIRIIAVVARQHDSVEFVPTAPCGACRQVMGEFEDKQKEAITLLFLGEAGKIYKVSSLVDLLPFRFSAATLKG
jgi:cytidine deaminase